MIVYMPVHDHGRFSIVEADTEKTIAGRRIFRPWGKLGSVVYGGTIYFRAFRTEAEAWNYIHGEYAVPLTLEELEELSK